MARGSESGGPVKMVMIGGRPPRPPGRAPGSARPRGGEPDRDALLLAERHDGADDRLPAVERERDEHLVDGLLRDERRDALDGRCGAARGAEGVPASSVSISSVTW
jgi:hypothetical protein